jgi:replicative DNA helicase
MNAINPPAEQLVNYDAEMAYLGACLANNEVWHKIADRLLPEHFADALHGRVYEAIGRLIQRGVRADPTTLKNLFDQDGALAEIGGAKYLVDLAQSVPTIIGAEDYGLQVIELARRRLVAEALETAQAEVKHFGAETTSQTVIEALESRLSSIAMSGSSERGSMTAGDAMRAAIDEINQIHRGDQTPGCPTGMLDLDKVLRLYPSDLIILAGRPSMGKTALAATIGRGAAKSGRRVDFFTLEMGNKQIGNRLIAMETGITVEDQRSGEIKMGDFDTMMEAQNRLDSLPLYLEDEPGLTAAAIMSRARRRQRTTGLDLVIVDYLQLIKPAASQRRESKYSDVSDISAALKYAARKLDVPVIALCQLSRSVEQRDDKRPMLSDLRDSGAIEQDADAVVFVYREQYYLERAEPKQQPGESDEKFQKRSDTWNRQMDACRNKAEVIVAKNRHGPTRTATLRFDGPRQEFQDLARAY